MKKSSRTDSKNSKSESQNKRSLDAFIERVNRSKAPKVKPNRNADTGDSGLGWVRETEMALTEDEAHDLDL